jgi:hypothetical protein
MWLRRGGSACFARLAKASKRLFRCCCCLALSFRTSGARRNLSASADASAANSTHSFRKWLRTSPWVPHASFLRSVRVLPFPCLLSSRAERSGVEGPLFVLFFPTAIASSRRAPARSASKRLFRRCLTVSFRASAADEGSSPAQRRGISLRLQHSPLVQLHCAGAPCFAPFVKRGYFVTSTSSRRIAFCLRCHP